jgi:hypothetical protein
MAIDACSLIKARVEEILSRTAHVPTGAIKAEQGNVAMIEAGSGNSR